MPNTEEELGSQATLDKFVDGSLTTFSDDRTFTINNEVLWYLDNLETLDIPRATFGSSGTIMHASKLEDVNVYGATTKIFYDGYSGSSYAANPKHFRIHSTTNPTSNSDPNTNGITIKELGLGAIYVPASKVSWYQANQYWGKHRIEPLANYPLTSFGTISDSWDAIIEACSDGTYETKYPIGGTKSLVVDGTTILCTLVAKDTDVLDSDGVTTIPTTWITFPCSVGISYFSRSSMDWESSDLRTYLNGTIRGSMASALGNALKKVRKTFFDGSTTKNVGDWVWAPSVGEVLWDYTGSAIDPSAYEDSGVQYDVSSLDAYTINATARTAVRNRWWTRSKVSSNNANAVCVNPGEVVSTLNGVNNQASCVFGFCI